MASDALGREAACCCCERGDGEGRVNERGGASDRYNAVVRIVLVCQIRPCGGGKHAAVWCWATGDAILSGAWIKRSRSANRGMGAQGLDMGSLGAEHPQCTASAWVTYAALADSTVLGIEPPD